MSSRIAVWSAVVAAWGVFWGAAPATAQTSSAAPSDFPAFELPAELGLPGLNAQNEEPTFSSQFQLEEGTREGRLLLTINLPPEWHVYSLTQKPGGPLKSKIAVDPVPGVEVTGPFEPNRDPEVHFYPEIYEPDLPVEEHSGQVTWTAPIRLAEGVAPEQLQITGKYNGLRCRSGDQGACIPVSHPFTASFAGYYQAADASGEYQAPNSKVTIRGYLEPQTVEPGGTATLVLEAAPEEGFHVYAYSPTPPDNPVANKPTLIVLPKTSGLEAGAPEASSAPVVKPAEGGLPEQRYHEGTVRWTIPLRIPKDAAPGPRIVAGQIGYQVCTDTFCLPPTAAAFEGTLTIGPARQEGQAPLAFAASKYNDAAQLAEAAPARASGDAPATISYAPVSLGQLATMIGFGLLGGLILNLMPCVLPVIGLKIMAFAQQGGESRGRVLALNLSFSLGLLAVFLILATLAAFAQLGWGEQFTNLWFKVAMTALVFAMALSFLGVWELPIPGFSGGRKAHDLQEREGLDGAFYKGVFTTVLATPCSGPFLGPVFGFTLTQPPWVTYVIFGSVGVGMASPYLLLSVFPGLIRFLPRPGMWMETFKQLMGFVLLGTVVFLFSTINSDYFIPTLTLLVGIWFACWWIGRTSYAAQTRQRVTAWLGGLATAAAVGVAAFTLLAPSKQALPWQPWSPTALAQAQAEGKTVLVDFTADWCLTCKANLKFAINTEDVRKLVEEHDIQPLLADWTDESEEIKQALAELGSNSIPLLAIYPADRPGEPIVLRDLLTEGQVIEALKQAGPSKTAQARRRPAMTASLTGAE